MGCEKGDGAGDCRVGRGLNDMVCDNAVGCLLLKTDCGSGGSSIVSN